MIRLKRVAACTFRSMKSISLAVYFSLPLIVMLVSNAMSAGKDPDRSVARMSEIVDALRKKLGISADVHVRIVENNRLGLSVQPADRLRKEFVLLVDIDFLSHLNEDDMTAALAHELGHVWIYTHHPFLHTEALANKVAMRVVERDLLKQLYAKLWAFLGTSGNLDDLLGPEPSAIVVAR